jgi:hypothetical protein
MVFLLYHVSLIFNQPKFFYGHVYQKLQSFSIILFLSVILLQLFFLFFYNIKNNTYIRILFAIMLINFNSFYFETSYNLV